MLKFRDIVKPINLDIRQEVSYQPSYFFERNYGYKIDYDVRLSDGTSLQRDFVWTLQQKQELIISIIKGILLPRFAAIVYEDDQKGKLKLEQDKIFKIIDGKQRLSTIQAFMNNEFPILFKGNEYFYNDFDSELKRSIWGCDLRFNIVYEYFDQKVSDEDMIRWFELINWAGTPQDKKHFEKLKNLIK